VAVRADRRAPPWAARSTRSGSTQADQTPITTIVPRARRPITAPAAIASAVTSTRPRIGHSPSRASTVAPRPVTIALTATIVTSRKRPSFREKATARPAPQQRPASAAPAVAATSSRGSEERKQATR